MSSNTNRHHQFDRSFMENYTPDQPLPWSFEVGKRSTVGEVLDAQKRGEDNFEAQHTLHNPSIAELAKYCRDYLNVTDRGEEGYPKNTVSDDVVKTRLTVSAGLCVGCEKNEKELKTILKACTGCKKAKYCGKECQKQNWKRHKGVCKKL